MTQEELNNKIAELEKQIAELKQVKVEKGWKPLDGETYYSVDIEYNDADEYINDIDGWFDEFRIDIGNCFKTKEEAEEFGKKLTTQLKYKKYVKEHSEPMDWINGNQEKHFLYKYENLEEPFISSTCFTKNTGTVYASSEKVIKDAIEYIGKDNVRYLFED